MKYKIANGKERWRWNIKYTQVRGRKKLKYEEMKMEEEKRKIVI